MSKQKNEKSPHVIQGIRAVDEAITSLDELIERLSKTREQIPESNTLYSTLTDSIWHLSIARDHLNSGN